MTKYVNVLFSPAEFKALRNEDLSGTACVVFDVLRATSSMITALANGATGLIPVAEIEEALELRRRDPSLLLAGERDGLRITANQTGSIDFDLGNSPREFTREEVAGRTIVITTTNGTLALRACQGAASVFAVALLNLNATAERLRSLRPDRTLIVCSGTFEEAAYEDTLAAGALVSVLWGNLGQAHLSDSALMARNLYESARNTLEQSIGSARNGRRLLSRPELRDDVAFCCRVDAYPLIAELGVKGVVRGTSQP